LLKLKEIWKKLEKDKSAICGELEQLFAYMQALKKDLNVAEAEINVDANRINEIHNMNIKAQKNLDAIPYTIKVTETTTKHGWWLWRCNYVTTIVKDVKNPDKESSANFISGLIRSRYDHIKEIKNLQDRTAEKLKILEREVVNTEGRIAQLKADLNSFIDEKGIKQQEIISTVKKIEEAQKIIVEDKMIEDKIGLRGGTLINCLLSTRKFLRSNQNQTFIMRPLINILDNVQEVFKYHMDLLKTKKRTLLYIAGEGLLYEIAILDSCISSLHDISVKTLESRGLNRHQKTLEIR